MTSLKGTGAPHRIQIQRVAPQVDGGRHAVKSTVGDPLEVSADVFRDGHELLGAAVSYRPTGERRWRETLMHEEGNDRWTATFVPDRCGAWEFAVEAWVDRFASFRDELQRKFDAGQDDLSGELSEGAALFGVESLTVEDALTGTEADRSERIASPVYPVDVDVLRVRFGSWYELFPRSWGGFSGVERLLPELAELGFDVVYLPPVHPIGHTNRKGKNNAATAGPDDPGSPWDRLGGRRAYGGQPRARDARGLRSADRACARARDRRRARLRDPVLAGPSVAEGASRVVPQAPGRDAEVRREPAQEVPGHLQRQLRLRGLAGPLAGTPRRRPLLDRPWGTRLSRGQSAHEARSLLGVADRRDPAQRPGRLLPGRSLHASGDDEDARQGRLQPVLHVLHLEEHEVGAAGVHAGGPRVVALLPAELLRKHPGHPPPLPPGGRPARVRSAARAGGDALADLRHLLGLRALRERATRGGERGVRRLGEVRGQAASARRAAPPTRAAPEHDPQGEPGAPARRQRRVPRDRERPPLRLREAAGRQRGPRCCEPRPVRSARGGRGRAGRRR